VISDPTGMLFTYQSTRATFAASLICILTIVPTTELFTGLLIDLVLFPGVVVGGVVVVVGFVVVVLGEVDVVVEGGRVVVVLTGLGILVNRKESTPKSAWLDKPTRMKAVFAGLVIVVITEVPTYPPGGGVLAGESFSTSSDSFLEFKSKYCTVAVPKNPEG
jgi:hypothetical protein